MNYVEAPGELHKPLLSVFGEQPLSVFLAGGISNCPDWQAEVVEKATKADLNVTLLNPRRKNFDTSDKWISVEQIEWEYRHLRRADCIAFWFPKETLCPIALYELGAWTMRDKPMVVGIEPGYERELDVRIQTNLERPDIPIVGHLDDLIDRIAVEWGFKK